MLLTLGRIGGAKMDQLQRLEDKVDEIRGMVHDIHVNHVKLSAESEQVKKDVDNHKTDLKDLKAAHQKAQGAMWLMSILFALYELFKK